jgi:hypothetical protein
MPHEPWTRGASRLPVTFTGEAVAGAQQRSSQAQHVRRGLDGRQRARVARGARWLSAFAVAVATIAPVTGLASTVYLNVVSARTEPRAGGGAGVVQGEPVTAYRYVINVDNTGSTAGSPSDTPACRPDTNPAYPAGCDWPSIRAMPGSSPIYTQGDQTDFLPGSGLTLPEGRYLISVLADGFKLDGAHFEVPGAALVTVTLQPHPLPTATIQAAVFEDISPVNGAPDAPAERGLAGFQGHLADYIGEVTTDVFGNPLCTDYERDPVTREVLLAPPDYAPTPIGGTGGRCLSACYDANDAIVAPADSAGRCPVGALGKLVIPNLGPNRYAVSVVPPDGTAWVQTTTLEGNLDWDNWVMEASTGLDTEFVQAGEPFPWSMFGYLLPKALGAGGAGTGEIRGVVVTAKVYIPATGGVPTPGTIWGGTSGARLDKPVPNPWIALSDLGNGDTYVYLGRGAADGTFTIPNVPAGTYTLTYWDADLVNILDLVNVTLAPGESVDVGWLPLTGWFTNVEGWVFNDLNRNGKRDPGEPGLANFPVSVKKRENSLMDRGAVTVTTDASGHYVMSNLYPLTQWLVIEAYSDLYYTTGVTFQTDNQNEATTILGAGVDVSVLPIIGLGGRLDWGVHAYDGAGRTRGLDPRNGGIVGTVSYDTTRNELDPRFAAVEAWQPGIPDLNVNLWAPAPCAPGAPCDPTGRYRLAPDGAYAKGKLLNVYVTETWARPTGCVARDLAGNPLTTSRILPSGADKECLEAPLMGVQFQSGFSTVDGNYGFVDGCFGAGGFDAAAGACADGQAPAALPAGDYLVEVRAPDDALGRPLYRVTREEDINIFDGDQWVPQIPPPACAGSLHTVDVAGVGTDGYAPVALPGGVVVPASRPTLNPAFAGGGGSPFEGQQKPLCDVKLVRVSNGRSVAPTFNFFTDVPLPGRLVTYMIDDLGFSTDPWTTFFGEKAGVAHAPVGIYDYTNRLVTTAHTDWNGVFDVLLPSTARINCPTPSGVCANLYRLVGNDPGTPQAPNPDYRPQFRTISAIFEVLPGLLVPADLAPTQIGVTIQLPGSQFSAPVTCPVSASTPQLFAVSRPYGPVLSTVTLDGLGFGAEPGRGRVTLDGVALTVVSWSDRRIVATVPAAMPAGPHQLEIANDAGKRSVNGLTYHVLGVGYAPVVREVGPGHAFATVQAAVDAAAAAGGPALVVVYPGAQIAFTNPLGAYFENVIMHAPVKLQGVGPGGFQGATYVRGSILDGGAFGGDTALAQTWRTTVAGLAWDGNQTVYEGAVVYVLAQDGAFGSGFRAAIDGFTIRGGDQQGFPTNLNQIGGTPTGLPPDVTTQGGGIFANAYARWLQITNNVITNNGGAYGGAVRLGTPNLPAPGTSNENQNVRIANNRIVANGGTNLAGGIGIFAGADGYEIAANDICGNFSAEYGGGLTVYGLSPNGKIHHNRIYLNRAYDEGGGVMIAGELPATPTALSPGTGSVDVFANVVQGNLSNDDGGGIRFLMAGNFPMNVYDNFIVNNVSTHEGGGVSINDAPRVRVFANTIMKNVTTATATTSNGLPAPAGLSTSRNSTMLQATLPPGSPVFSEPLVFDNVFWDNRAGTRAGGSVIGIGAAGDGTAVNRWDLGVADATGLLRPTYSILQTTLGTALSATNRAVDPAVVQPYDVGLSFVPWRTNPNFVDAILVSFDLPPDLMGDYHLTSGSPAINAGTPASDGVSAPAVDIDGDVRLGGFDLGADELASPATALGFPTTGYLDLFNRPDGALGASWAGDLATGTYRIVSSLAQARASGTAWWSPQAFGAGQEAFYTLTRVTTGATWQGLVLKLVGNPATTTASYIEVLYGAGAGEVQVRTVAPGQGAVLRGTFAATFVAGDLIGARAEPSGAVTVFRNGAPVGAVDVAAGATPWPSSLVLGGGRIGIRHVGATRFNDGQLDNFGGGTLP